MAKSRTRQSRRALTVLSVLMTALLSAACSGVVNPGFVLKTNICKEFDDTPLTPLSAPSPNDPTNPKPIFETAGQIKVMHGFGSAQLDSGNRSSRSRRALLRDDDFKEGYSFTYHFTVIAWNDAALSVSIDQGSPDNFCNAATALPDKSFVAINKDTTTALSSFSVFSQEPGLPRGKPVAVLPRGFAYLWWGGDHHMLQLGYNLDHSEIFAAQGKIYSNNPDHVHTAGDLMTGKLAPLPTPASLVDSGFVSWNTYAIFKDNDSRRDYVFSELVSTAGGNDVGIIQPPFALLPKEGDGGNEHLGGVKSEEVVIENIPFEYAVPLLTGWDLNYETDDQHVKEVGIWIDDWSFSGDTLSYKLSSILRDDDSTPAHSARHKVTILGIRPIVSGSVPRQSR